MKKITLTLFLVLCTSVHALYAQRHYAGVEALEMNYGLNIFGRSDNNLNFSYSKFKNRTTYWKVGLNYFEKSFNYNYEDVSLGDPEMITLDRKAKDYFLDAVYAKTVATNMTSVFFNLGLGAFTGVEAYKEESTEYDFLLGAKIEAELEYFISGRVALLGRVTQYWSPFSDISQWNTTWNVGVKVLLY